VFERDEEIWLLLFAAGLVLQSLAPARWDCSARCSRARFPGR
jgi:hypothetical protein